MLMISVECRQPTAPSPPPPVIPLQGIPSAAFLAFKRGLGMYGLWWGLVIVNTVQARAGPPAVCLSSPRRPACCVTSSLSATRFPPTRSLVPAGRGDDPHSRPL